MNKRLEELYTADTGILLVVSGPAGAGKGSAVNWLVEHDEHTFLSISETTRAPRAGDSEGITYYFVDRETFEGRIEEEYYLEYAHVYGNYYGTPRERILNRLRQGENVILEIEMQGAQKIKKILPEAVLVFIMPPSYEILRERITGRGSDSAEEIERRMNCTKQEIEEVPKYDYVIVNKEGKLEETGRILQDILTAEKHKTSRILSNQSEK